MDICLILDPMLATGGSATAAIEVLKHWGATRIKLVNLIAAPEGVRAVSTAHPDVAIYCASAGPRSSTRRATSCPAWATPATASSAPADPDVRAGSATRSPYHRAVEQPDRPAGASAPEQPPRPALLCITPSPAIDRTAHVGRIVHGEILRPIELVALPGGKGVNAARAAARLGGRVMTTGIAGGHAGRWIVESLAAEGLDPHWAPAEAESRTTYVTVDHAGTSVIVYERPCVRQRRGVRGLPSPAGG